MIERLRPYGLLIVALLLIALFVLALLAPAPLAEAPTSESVATSTASVMETVTTVAATTSTPTKVAPKAKQTVREVTAPAPTALAVAEPVNLDPAAASLRAALVNILCLAPSGSRVRSISGSGVIIDSKGIVLTNAHIAQHFLLKSEGVACTVRTGSPAVAAYVAELIYVPTAWIETNAKLLIDPNPTGTGEADFALLAITDSATSAPLPSAFSMMPLAVHWPAVGTPIVIGGYAAQFLQGEQIRSSLFPTLVFGSVKGLFTFGTNTPDVIELGGSAAAQEGSSGGGVAGAAGTLLGTITTSTIEGDTSGRVLSAITATYIRGAYERATSASLSSLLSAPTADSVAAFKPAAFELSKVLRAQL